MSREREPVLAAAFEPKDDITVQELARLLRYTVFSRGMALDWWSVLPLEVRRHFETRMK